MVSGDTVDSIAAKFNITVEELVYINQISSPYKLAIGQALLIIMDEAPSDRRSVNVNGYAYPFINEWTLEQTLSYLTDMSVFSYGFTKEGNLIAPELPDEWMISLAYQNATRPILTLTPLDENGKFNNQLIHSVVQNDDSLNNLIEQLLATVEYKGYAGVDIDFEYILKEDKDDFTEFVRRVTQTMNENGYTASVALAPKTSDNQKGVLYEGKDYEALGAVANSVLLMTYEWGYKYAHRRYG